MANLCLNSFKVKVLGWYLKCRWSVGIFLFFLLDCEESLLLLDSVVWSDFSELVLLWDPIPIQSLSEVDRGIVEVDWQVEPCLELRDPIPIQSLSEVDWGVVEVDWRVEPCLELWDPIPIQSLSEVDWGVVEVDCLVEPCKEFFIRANCSEMLLNIEANCSNWSKPIAGDGGGVVCIEEYVRFII